MNMETVMLSAILPPLKLDDVYFIRRNNAIFL